MTGRNLRIFALVRKMSDYCRLPALSAESDLSSFPPRIGGSLTLKSAQLGLTLGKSPEVLGDADMPSVHLRNRICEVCCTCREDDVFR